MNKTEKRLLVSQIIRLCEKQYRKGFQQGFHRCVDKSISLKDVDHFRFKGSDENYSKMIDPITGRKIDPFLQLGAEMEMGKMDELKELFLDQEIDQEIDQKVQLWYSFIQDAWLCIEKGSWINKNGWKFVISDYEENIHKFLESRDSLQYCKSTKKIDPESFYLIFTYGEKFPNPWK